MKFGLIARKLAPSIWILLFVALLIVACNREQNPNIVDCITWEYKGSLYQSTSGSDKVCNPGLAKFDNVTFDVACSAGGCLRSVVVVSGSKNQQPTAP